jgi:hypothetical protein
VVCVTCDEFMPMTEGQSTAAGAPGSTSSVGAPGGSSAPLGEDADTATVADDSDNVAANSSAAANDNHPSDDTLLVDVPAAPKPAPGPEPANDNELTAELGATGTE